MDPEVDASVMVPSRRSCQHGLPSLTRVRMPIRSPRSPLLRSPPNPLLHRSPLRFPSRRPTTAKTLVLSHAPRAPETRCMLESFCNGIPIPESPWRDRSLPGCWAILFARAVVIHTPPVRHRLARYWWQRCCLQEIRRPGLYRDVLFSAPHSHGSRVCCLRWRCPDLS